MIYRVVLSYMYFDFEDMEEAMIFATTARIHHSKISSEKIMVEIRVLESIGEEDK